eukprot:6072703-Alexandrium_andersonii.AAC.1
MHVVYCLQHECRVQKQPIPERSICRAARHLLAGARKGNSRDFRLFRHLKGGAGPRERIWPAAPPPPALWKRGNRRQPRRLLY